MNGEWWTRPPAEVSVDVRNHCSICCSGSDGLGDPRVCILYVAVWLSSMQCAAGSTRDKIQRLKKCKPPVRDVGVRNDQKVKDGGEKKEQKTINLERGPAYMTLGGGRS